GGFFSLQNFANDGGVVGCVAAGDGLQAGAGKAELLRRHFIAAHAALAHLGHASRRRYGDFIQAIIPVNHQGAMHAQHAERFRQFLHQIGGVNTHHLGGGGGRVGERAEQIEYSAQAQFAARGLHVFHGRVHGGGEQKRDAHLLQAGGEAGRGERNVDAQRFHNVGGAALGSHAPVAVLGHAHAGAGHHQRGGGGNVEGTAGIAAGAAGVHQGIALGAADVECGIAADGDRGGGGADGLG